MGVRHIWASAGTHVRIHRRRFRPRAPRVSVHRTIVSSPHSDYSWVWKALAVIAGIIVVCYLWKVIVGIVCFALFILIVGSTAKAFMK